MRADGVLILGKELRRYPQRARLELRARSAAAAIAVRNGARFVATLEARLKGQQESGSSIVRAHLLELGVDPARIVLANQTRSTREECVAARDLVQEHGLSRLAVVTHAYHLDRVRSYLRDAMPQTSWVAGVPESWIRDATPVERAWIEAATCTPETFAQERSAERVFGGLAALLAPLPRDLRERVEISAGGFYRRVGES
jgi:hypothetical protein